MGAANFNHINFSTHLKIMEFKDKYHVRVLQNRIQRQISCPATREQNGVAERMHRHIVETRLTLLLHANLPKSFWAEA